MVIESLSERKRQVLKILTENAGTSVSEISEQLGVSAVTIRSDLEGLAENGLIIRTRGGGVPAFHQNILDRQKSMGAEKIRIAKAAADLVTDGDRIMIVAGTTTSLIPRFLLGRRDVHIVTNSTLLLPYVRINPALHVTMIGGRFFASAEAMVGPIAVRQLAQFHVRMAFLGTDGFSVDKGFTAHQVEVAEVVRHMAGQAEQSILCVDSSKQGKAGFAHILPLSEVSSIITDDRLSGEAQSDLESCGISVKTV
jgi:DeoR/GlpR family transcriptional regulator of sugar metabolism